MLSAMQDRADRKLEVLLDNSEYDESQLIEIRVTMNMPYQQRYTEYERHYGEVEIDGKTYTYVKRKVEGDVVVLKCIPNKSKQELKAIDSDLTEANTGIDTDNPGKQQKQSSFAKNFWSEYDGQIDFNIISRYTSLNKPALTAYSFYIPQVTRNTPHQPPKC